MSKESPSIETVVKKIVDTAQGSDIEEVFKVLNKQRSQEVQSLIIERIMAEEKARIMKANQENVAPNAGMTTNYLATILHTAQVDPARAKEFLTMLDEDDIRKLGLMQAMGQGGGVSPYLPLLKSDGLKVKDIVEIVKLMQPPAAQGSSDGKAMAEVFRAAVEVAKAQPQQQGLSPMDLVKEIVLPFQQQVNAANQAAWNERLNNLQQQIVNPMDYFKNIQDAAKQLGFQPAGGGSTNPEIQIQLETLRGNQDRELEKMKFDRQLQMAQFTADREDKQARWHVVENLMSGPLGQVVSNLGSSAARRLEPPGAARFTPAPAPRPILIGCPQCGHKFPGSSDATKVICPGCGATLEVVNEPSPTPQPPPGGTSDEPGPTGTAPAPPPGQGV